MRHLTAIAFLACLLLPACAREIGDDCGTNADCGTGRFCDTSQPGGYCTLTPCRPDTCPNEALCVEFTADDTYCMRKCIADDECRMDYRCILGYLDYQGFCNQLPPEDQTGY